MTAATPTSITKGFLHFADSQCAELPLYDLLCRHLGTHALVIEMLLAARAGQARPNLVLAALHDAVLADREDPLARFFPTCGGQFDPTQADEVRAAVDGLINRRADWLSTVCATRATQTNEPNRSALWELVRRDAAAASSAPVAWIELGASAGINLCLDAFRYAFDDVTVGVIDAPVTVTSRLDTTAHSLLRGPRCELAAVVGIDLEPIRPDDDAGWRWLKACIFAERTDRHLRFDAASRMTRTLQPRLVKGDILDELEQLVIEVPTHFHLVVVNSWVMTYIRRDRRDALFALLDQLGSQRQISWYSAEAERVIPWVPSAAGGPFPDTVVGRYQWNRGRIGAARVAHCHPHLDWLHWIGPANSTQLH